MMLSGDLKKALAQVDDYQRIVFEFQENGQPAKESFSVDRAEPRSGYFFMLISEEFDVPEEKEIIPEGVGD